MITPIQETTSVAKNHGLHLHTKVLLALGIMSVLPLSATMLLDSKLSADAETRAVFIDFIATTVDIGGYSVHFYALFVLAIFGASLAAAGIYMEMIFVRPVRALNAWVETGKKEGFEKMSVMPAPHSRDVGELGHNIASALTFAFQTRSANRSLSTKKDELVVIAAHQLRTPLTGLKWAVQTLDDKTLTESALKTVNEIRSTIQRIGLIVDNIVASADIEEGRFGYSFSEVNIVDVIKKAIADLNLTIQRRELNIVFDEATVAKPVFIDAYRMTTAIYNILENAVEYTPQGGKITIMLTDRQDALELSIQDTGIGIPQSQTQYLFTKFYRGENAKHMRPDGSGLGLYLAKHVVEAHNQQIWLESIEGKGTKVTIPLPYTAPKV